MPDVSAYAVQSNASPLEKTTIHRRELTHHDVAIDILYCGVCHSDIHMARNDWGISVYPLVPGHEIIGRVSKVGDQVTKYQVGDLVGVGCMVGSCENCSSCNEGLEQYCNNGFIMTYGSEDPKFGGVTLGGYSKSIVVEENFVLKVPTNLEISAVAPLLCAGVTMWSPLRHWQVKPGDKVGIIGLGGLGHMGIKLANALGANVVMISRSKDKANDAKRLGAHEILSTTDEQAMTAAAESFDLLINTIPVDHDLNPYLPLLKRDATMVLVGAIGDLTKNINSMPIVFRRKQIAGSLIGGIKETQEMLDFCGKHNITADVELIKIDNINLAYDRMIASEVKYRFVIDMDSL